MFTTFNKKISSESKLYNKIMFFSRNKFLYKEIGLSDTFNVRIVLIFFHLAFLLIKLKSTKNINESNQYSQRIFDHAFKKIEENLREHGYGDVTVNKNMKNLVKIFYNILLDCEKYLLFSFENKIDFLDKYLNFKNNAKKPNIIELIKYLDHYQTFCCDLSINSVIKGDLNFKYWGI